MKIVIINGVEYAPVVKTTEIKTLSRSINIEVYHNRLLGKLTWYDAQEYCKFLGEGWRLPTISEMFYLYEDKIITEDGYWSNTDIRKELAWYFHFTNGHASYYKKLNEFYVCAVRDIKTE